MPAPLPEPPRPFLPSDFDEACEDCPAGPGEFCRDGCPSGYTAEDYRADAARSSERSPQTP